MDPRALFNNPLTLPIHETNDIHYIGEALPAPSSPATLVTAGNVASTGGSGVPAREDHVHSLDIDELIDEIDDAGTTFTNYYTTTEVDALITATDPVYSIACSDESTAISATGSKVKFRIPFAMSLSDIRASLNSACTTGTFTINVKESGTTIFSTKLTIDATEKTSETAATAHVFSDSSLADDAEMEILVDNVGDGTATGLKVSFYG